MGTYEIRQMCTWCKTCYGTKPGGNTPGLESHGFCGEDCVTTYCNSIGIDPAPIIKTIRERENEL